MRILIVALALLWAGVTPAAAQGAGSWSGVGFQVDAGGKQSEWTMTLSIRANGGARVAYPSLGCEGEWKRAGENVWTEIITVGECISGGTVSIVPVKGRLIWYWTGENTSAPSVSATAVLYPAGVS